VRAGDELRRLLVDPVLTAGLPLEVPRVLLAGLVAVSGAPDDLAGLLHDRLAGLRVQHLLAVVVEDVPADS
jgi:hypothetical protein